jgi:hypothetical protein
MMRPTLSVVHIAIFSTTGSIPRGSAVLMAITLRS